MSVFGGDSWAREAQHRKKRIDDLMVESIDPSVYKKLASGKFACLVCPHNPVLDTFLMLSAHIKGSRHQAAESRLKGRDLARQDQINKRIALSDCPTTKATNVHPPERSSANKPLIERSRRAASEIVYDRTSEWDTIYKKYDIKSRTSGVTNDQSSLNNSAPNVFDDSCGNGVQRLLGPQEHRERELKFIASGWKRDCHGKWFKDENVEFDSDEEDPNVCLV